MFMDIYLSYQPAGFLPGLPDAVMESGYGKPLFIASCCRSRAINQQWGGEKPLNLLFQMPAEEVVSTRNNIISVCMCVCVYLSDFD